MKQYLFYQFRADIYKRSPLIRLYVNDILFDEFQIEKNQNILHTGYKKDFLDNEKLLDQAYYGKFRVVEFGHTSSQIKIRFDVKNNDNNFTNGFMTKCTSLNFRFCYLANENFLHNITSFQKKFRYDREKVFDLKDIKSWYKGQYHPLVENYAQTCSIECNDSQKYITATPQKSMTTGTNVSYLISLVKRHGFWLTHKNAKHVGIFRSGAIKNLKFLYNKYLCHENK